MHRGRILIPLLVLGLSVGCLWPGKGTGVNWSRPFSGPVGPDVVAVEVSVIEVPAGDRFLNLELWASIDEQILAPDLRRKLEDNGFRVAKVSGRPPDGLQDLLTSEKSNRSPRHVRVRSGNPVNVPLGPQRPTCQFIVSDGKDETLALEQAQGNLQITPVIGQDGQISLQFLPQMQHADKKKQGNLIPTIALGLQGNRATDGYPALKWETHLGLNEYLIVGSRLDKQQALGYRLFVTSEGEKPTQRVLAIRTGKVGGGDEALGQPGTPIRTKAPPPAPATPLSIP